MIFKNSLTMTTIIQIGNKDTKIKVQSDILECRMHMKYTKYTPVIQVIFDNNISISLRFSALQYGWVGVDRNDNTCIINALLFNLHQFLLTYSLDSIYKMETLAAFNNSIGTPKDSHDLIITSRTFYATISINETLVKQLNKVMSFIYWRHNIYRVNIMIRKK